MFILCRYLIPNDWKEISLWMRLPQNNLITKNPWIFWKIYFGLEAFSYSTRMELSLTKLFMSPQKKLVYIISKVHYFVSWSPVCTPLFPCHYHWNGWRPWLQQHTETRRAGSLQNYLHDEGKGIREETIFFFFFFFFDWILFCTIHIR